MKEKVNIHSSEDFKYMRKAGRLAADVLDMLDTIIKPGVSTGEINDVCHSKIIENNATPSPLNYRGFPKSLCTSVNHIVCHGIPSYDKILKTGDIVNVDVTVNLEGWHGDTSRMYLVGEADRSSTKARQLCKVTYEAMMTGIREVKPGAPFSNIGKAIEKYAKDNGYSTVEDFCGHGIGRSMHEAPNVLHYYAPEYDDMIMETGMFFTIEPMLNQGKKGVKILPDGWTAVTRDRSLSAQWEHSIGVTKDGYEIFTLSAKERKGELHKILQN